MHKKQEASFSRLIITQPSSNWFNEANDGIYKTNGPAKKGRLDIFLLFKKKKKKIKGKRFLVLDYIMTVI